MKLSLIHTASCMCVPWQTAILALLMKYLGPKHSIIFGLVFEMLQLLLIGFGSQAWYKTLHNHKKLQITSL